MTGIIRCLGYYPLDGGFSLWRTWWKSIESPAKWLGFMEWHPSKVWFRSFWSIPVTISVCQRQKTICIHGKIDIRDEIWWYPMFSDKPIRGLWVKFLGTHGCWSFWVASDPNFGDAELGGSTGYMTHQLCSNLGLNSLGRPLNPLLHRHVPKWNGHREG